MEFTLLISCPSDVNDEFKIIRETVDVFNSSIGRVNDAKIGLSHWSKDSYPQSGGQPQKLLNEQFVLTCDAAVAVFWTRFGTPTDEYGSGTEEEIEELIKSGKQVFLYFSDRLVNPSTIDREQYDKVTAFKDRYKERGIYGTYSDLDTFKRNLLNHLTLHFAQKMNIKEAKGNALSFIAAETPIEAFDFSVRTYYLLRRAGIDTIGDLLDFTLDDLSHFRDGGKRFRAEILARLKQYGLRLKTGPSRWNDR